MVLALGYAFLAQLGELLSVAPSSVTAIFPAAGFALGMLCLRGRSLWPGVWLGAMLGSTWIFHHPAGWSRTLLASALIATGATLQALAGQACMRRLDPRRRILARVGDVLRFALLTAALVCFINATIGSVSLGLCGIMPWRDLTSTWLTWWLGDTTGVVLVTPLLLVWSKPMPQEARQRLSPEGIGVALFFAVASFLAFSPWSFISEEKLPVLPMLMPPLVWGAVRLGRHGVTALALAIGLLALLNTELGFGYFAQREPQQALYLYDIYICIITITGLALAAAVEERSQAQLALEAARADLERRVIEQTQELRRTNEELVAEVRERRRAETAVREGEARLQALIDSLPFDVWATDAEGRYIVQNAAAERHWGNLLGRLSSELDAPAEIRDEWRVNNGRALAGETISESAEYPGDDESRSVLNIVSPIRLGDQIIGAGGVSIDVSDRLRFMRALDSSEQTYRSIFQSVTDGIFVHDIMSGEILDVNDRVVEMYGWTREEVRTLTIGELSAADEGYTQERGAERVRDAFSSEAVSFEWLALRKDGGKFWVEVALKRATINGRDSMLAIVRDISERKRVQEELRDKEARLSLLIGQLPAILWTTDRNLIVTSWAGSGLSRVNVSPSAIIGLNVETLAGRPERVEVVRAIHTRALNGESCAIDINWRGRSLELQLQPLRDAQERTIGVIGLALDVTERKQIAEERQAFEQQLRLVLDHTPLILFSLDRDGRCTICEGKGLQSLGWNPARIIGRTIFDVCRDAPSVVANARRALAGEEFTSIDEVARNGLIWEIIWFPIRGPDGSLEGSAAVALNVTDRVRVQRERDQLFEDERRARLGAEEAVRVRDDFLSIASHELKTPITALQYSVQGLVKLGAGESGLAHAPPKVLALLLDTIERQGKRLNKLVNVLLDVTRLEAGRFELDVDQVDLAALTREVVAHLQDELQRSGCTLELDAPEPVEGRWDRFRLEQVITNLLSNAMKYGAHAPISVAVSSIPGQALLIVKDHGIGIAPDRQGAIFERFERAVSARHYSGLGLGLYIARRIVSAHGGTIQVFSKPEEGSSFVVSLPYQPQLREREVRDRELGYG
jgi:PAS domain S-box-containing protein